MKIAVALCTYNGEKYLKKQLDSILHQEQFHVDEIVVCDDQSTDGTLAILSEYDLKFPEIFKICVNETNLGSTFNFEKAIAICTGDFIFLSDQDDIWKSNKISKTIAFFEENPTAQGVFSNADLIDENDQEQSQLTLWDSIYFLEKKFTKPVDLFELISKNGNVVTGATLCLRKEVKSFIFPFNTTNLHDEWIASILALRKTLVYIPENLISYRIHQNQQVGVQKTSKILKKNKLKRIILGLQEPKTFAEYRVVLKKQYRYKNSFSKFEKLTLDPNIKNEFEAKSNQEFEDFKIKIKKKFPIKYLLSKLLDTCLGKRK